MDKETLIQTITDQETINQSIVTNEITGNCMECAERVQSIVSACMRGGVAATARRDKGGVDAAAVGHTLAA